MQRSRLHKISRTRSRSVNRRLKQPSLYSRTETVKEKRTYSGFFRLFVFILAASALVYLVFISGVFSVDNFEYSPTQFVDRGELERVVKGNKMPIIDNNIITFGIFGFSERVEKVTGIEKAKVKRVGQHSLRIEVVEKSPLLVWQTSDRKYLVDDSGVVWANFEEKYASLPNLLDTKNLPIKLGDKVLPAGFIVFFKDLKDNFETETGAKMVKFEIMDIVSDLKVTTDAGWYVYFDTARTAKNQLISLKRVLQEAQNTKTKLEYVDLRINNRIFYK